MDNVELVRRALDRYNEAGEVPWESIDPAVAWVIDDQAFVGGSYRGHDGVRAMLRDLAESFARVQFDFDEWFEAGDRVAALGRLKIRGDQSGVEASQPIGYVFRVEQGLITAARAYLQPEEALTAIGHQR